MFEIVLRRKSYFFWNTVIDRKYDQIILMFEHIFIKKKPKVKNKKIQQKNPPKNKQTKQKKPKQTFIKYE